jgi:L-ascorbate metabolism protein UlaG (beta-lactamase superfamily)
MTDASGTNCVTDPEPHLRKTNPFYDPGKPHHTPYGFRNLDPQARIGGDFWRWRRERRAAGLPRQPDGGYKTFAERWLMQPDFRYDPSSASHSAVWWLGHATVLLRINGMHVITDPHLSHRASPLPFLGPERKVPAPAGVRQLPKIDAVLVSHSHYDHLDTETVRQLLRANPAVTFYVPLGLANWLRARGAQHVEELDWWDRREQQELEIHCVPAQHWSARTLFDRNRTLWCGWVVRAPGFSFYFSGDTGYTPQLSEISIRLGTPSLAALPIGAYEPRWFMRGQHIDPDEAVRLHRELGVAQSLAIHWGTFELADDSLDEPLHALQQSLLEQDVDNGTFWILKQGEHRLLR